MKAGGGGDCLPTPFCDRMSKQSSWLTLWHSHLHRSVHESFRLHVHIHIRTYGSAIVCLHAFPIFVTFAFAFAYRIFGILALGKLLHDAIRLVLSIVYWMYAVASNFISSLSC